MYPDSLLLLPGSQAEPAKDVQIIDEHGKLLLGKWHLPYYDNSLSGGKTHLASIRVTELNNKPDGTIHTIGACQITQIKLSGAGNSNFYLFPAPVYHLPSAAGRIMVKNDPIILFLLRKNI